MVAAAAVVPVAACGPRAVHTKATSPALEIAGLELLGHYSLSSRRWVAVGEAGGVSGLAVDPTTKEINRHLRQSPGQPCVHLRNEQAGHAISGRPAGVFPFAHGPWCAVGAGFRGDRTHPLGPHVHFVRGPAAPGASRAAGNSRGHAPGGLCRPAPRFVEFCSRDSGPLNHGVRENEGFESLTLTPDEGRLFTASETSLTQDGEKPTFDQGTTARLLEFVSEGGQNSWRVANSRIHSGRVPRVEFTPRFTINGPSSCSH